MNRAKTLLLSFVHGVEMDKFTFRHDDDYYENDSNRNTSRSVALTTHPNLAPRLKKE